MEQIRLTHDHLDTVQEAILYYNQKKSAQLEKVFKDNPQMKELHQIGVEVAPKTIVDNVLFFLQEVALSIEENDRVDISPENWDMIKNKTFPVEDAQHSIQVVSEISPFGTINRFYDEDGEMIYENTGSIETIDDDEIYENVLKPILKKQRVKEQESIEERIKNIKEQINNSLDEKNDSAFYELVGQLKALQKEQVI